MLHYRINLEPIECFLLELEKRYSSQILQTEPSYTKYKNVNQKIYDIDKIWSLDLAYVDKLAITTIMLNICLLQSTACMISQSATPDIKVCYYESKSVRSNDNDKKPEKSWDGQGHRV